MAFHGDPKDSKSFGMKQVKDIESKVTKDLSADILEFLNKAKVDHQENLDENAGKAEDVLILALKAYKSHLNELINKDTKALKSR